MVNERQGQFTSLYKTLEVQILSDQMYIPSKTEAQK